MIIIIIYLKLFDWLVECCICCILLYFSKLGKALDLQPVNYSVTAHIYPRKIDPSNIT